MCTSKRHLALLIIVTTTILTGLPRNADATIVEFQTVLGDFQVNLYDNATPDTVANFLNYVENGAYSDSIIHRSAPGFVIQGGGITYDGTTPLVEIPENAQVTNEPDFSNVRGTISMAKLNNQPNSATSQFFFNLTNNSGSLDGENGGYTVFGQVVGDGMDVVDAIAALPLYALGSPLNELPLRDYVANDPLDTTNLVIVTKVLVFDNTVDTSAGLNRPANTANNDAGDGGGSGGGGGGSFGLFAILGLLLVRGVQRLA
jgi:peptidyl-prolyl cis-trans isomerase A (cyclophilin A)